MATLKNTVINDTGYLQLPAGSTAQRPAGTTGMIRVNTNTTPYVLEIYQSGTWRTLKVLQ
jgi:hypothetical protein